MSFNVGFSLKMQDMRPTSNATDNLARLEGFLRQDPDNERLLAEAFDVALSAGALEAAAFHLAHAEALALDPWRWGLNGVHLEFARHQWTAAQHRMAALAARGDVPPDLVPVLQHDQAYLHFRNGQWAAALDALAPLLARSGSPDAPIAGATQALLLRSWHRTLAFDVAMAWAKARETHGALDVEAVGVASLLAFDAGEVEASERWSRAARLSNAPGIEALVAGSSLALAKRDVASAERLAREALALDDSDGRAWGALGLALMAQRRLDEAQASLQRAVDGNPGHATSWLLLGWSRFLLSQFAQARDAFEHAIDCDRNFGEAHGALAVVQARLGETAAAKDSVERAWRLDRDGASAQYAQLLLSGADATDPAIVERLARRLLGRGVSSFGEPLDRWLDAPRDS